MAKGSRRAAGGSAAGSSRGYSAGLHRQQQQRQGAASYDPALAAARARAGLMDGAGGGRARGRCSSPFAGYEPGYEVEIRSSTFYRPRPGTSTDARPCEDSQRPRRQHHQQQHQQRASSTSSMLRSSGRFQAASGSTGSTGSSSPVRSAGSPDRYMFAADGSWHRVAGSAVWGPAEGLATSTHSTLARAADAHRGSGGGGACAAGDAPLDDLLQHVNALIREFDSLYAGQH